MVDVSALRHAYGRHEALHDVSIHLRGGETLAVLGANGAGKTSLLNAIAGIVRPTLDRYASTAPSWWACRRIGSSSWVSPPCRRTVTSSDP
jgi:ABC-type multidrug transport system ATPase subunit